MQVEHCSEATCTIGVPVSVRGNLSANVGATQAGFNPLPLHPGKFPTGSIAVHGREGFCEAVSEFRDSLLFDVRLGRKPQ